MNYFKHVLTCIDLGDVETSKKVLNAALETINKQEDVLHVICVVPNYGAGVVGAFFSSNHEQEMMDKAQQSLHEFTGENVPEGVKVQHIIGHGSVYEEVLANAKKVGADLIVVGSHRPALKDYLLGPNAARIVRHAQQSVLVVRYD